MYQNHAIKIGTKIIPTIIIAWFMRYVKLFNKINRKLFVHCVIVAWCFICNAHHSADNINNLIQFFFGHEYFTIICAYDTCIICNGIRRKRTNQFFTKRTCFFITVLSTVLKSSIGLHFTVMFFTSFLVLCSGVPERSI